MNWRVRAKDGRELVVDCETEIDARATGLRALAVDAVTVAPDDQDAEPEIAMRWVRSPGPPRNLLPEVRERIGGVWGPWFDERHFVYRSRP